ncbi:MAG: hypothetical protein ACRBBV_04700 [Paracoccaceae bacterium]
MKRVADPPAPNAALRQHYGDSVQLRRQTGIYCTAERQQSSKYDNIGRIKETKPPEKSPKLTIIPLFYG